MKNLKNCAMSAKSYNSLSVFARRANMEECDALDHLVKVAIGRLGALKRYDRKMKALARAQARELRAAKKARVANG